MKVALLGGTKGIGRSLGRLLAARGHDVCLLGRDRHELQASAQDMATRADRKNAFPTAACDLLQPESFASALDAAESSMDGLDTVIVTAEDAEEAEIMLSAGLRIRIGQRNDEPVWDGDHYRGRPPSGNGIRGYIEPEIQYWSGGGDNTDIDDLLLGVNLIGVVPTRNADYYLGVGFGLHFFDAVLTDEDGVVLQEDDDEKLGGNLQVGVDVNVSDNVALFGTGRLDILEGGLAERQTKVTVGLRFKF